MTKWEYLVELVYPEDPHVPWISQWNDELNAKGEEGWELVHLDGVRATFKRPKPLVVSIGEQWVESGL